jgi:hypothetical protein
MPKSGVAQPKRFLQDRVEHRREVAGRGIDDLQYLSGGGLPLKRFGEFSLSLGKPTPQFCVLALEIVAHRHRQAPLCVCNCSQLATIWGGDSGARPSLGQIRLIELANGLISARNE